MDDLVEVGFADDVPAPSKKQKASYAYRRDRDRQWLALNESDDLPLPVPVDTPASLIIGRFLGCVLSTGEANAEP